MTESRFDVLVIGAGHNGLTCAAYLARSGRRVLVLEAGDAPGGAAATREFHPGFRVSSGAHLLTHLNPRVSQELGLERHGLRYAATDLKTVALDGGDRAVVTSGAEVTGVSAEDRSAFAEFHRRNRRFARVLDGFFNRPIPALVERDLRDNLSLARLGWDVRRLGKQDMQELLRIGLMNVYDLANEHFDSELLKATVSLDAVLGSLMGPRSPNTVYGYLYRHLAAAWDQRGPALVSGGMGALGTAFANAARGFGADIRYGSAVARVRVNNGVVEGVELASGEAIDAPMVVSGVDPKTTFESLVGYRELDAGFARRIHNFRARGITAKLHLALDGLPDFRGVKADNLGDRLLLAPDMEYIEQAFNHAKYGRFSEAPAMEVSIPTVHDTSLAPQGSHVLSAVVQFAPCDLASGWDTGRDAFADICLATLERHAPGIGERVIARELLVPPDIEAEFGMYGGHWHHGEIALDQALMMRPVPGAHQYRTPVEGLYLCSAGSHPGGGVMGVAGRNAANTVIKQEKSA